MKLLNTSSCRSFFNLIPYICGSSLIYNTSARHKRYECDTSVTLATRVRHEQHKCNTSATQVLHERNERDTSATRTTQMQHEWKKLILISTRVKTLSTPLYLLDCNWTRTQNHLVCKLTLNHLPKWSVWINGWVFVYQLSGSGFESSCSQLNFRFRACFEQGVPWHLGNYRRWIHSETHTWHEKNIQCYIYYMASERLQGDEHFHSRNYLLEMPCFHAKMHLKSAPQN